MPQTNRSEHLAAVDEQHPSIWLTQGVVRSLLVPPYAA